MLRMQHVSKIYRTDLIETHALRDFSLEVTSGEFIAVSGPSGSGKTTFLNVAGLLESFESGSYELDGQDVSRLTDNARSQLRNQKIGFVFQSFNLIPDLDVYDNVDVPLRYRRLKSGDRHERITSALELVGLASRMRHMPSQLSGGQQQRVAIARALVNRPAILLADEPTGNLDSRTSVEIMEIFQRLNDRGLTVVLVTHEHDIAQFAKRVITFRDGLIRKDAPVTDRLRASEVLQTLPTLD